MARIQFESVRKQYPNGYTALEDLNLEIADKEFLVLLGPSGCGKSTTLNMIAGLEDVTDGNLRFDTEVMNTVPPHKRDVAMVFQSYALYPHKTVYDNIAFGLKMRKFEKAEIDRRVRDAARRLEIEPLLERRPDQLSGGQRQRVALGRAMVRKPQVFLMDEPLSNLDAALRISMRAEIKQLHEAMQTTFVYVTHDQAEALTLADRIVVMRGGVVQQIGSPDAIYERPSNMFVASFLGNPPINFLKGQLRHTQYRLVFRNGGTMFTLPAEAASKLSGYDGREVVLGIRAEDVAEADVATEGAFLSGRILSVLPVGSDQFLEIEVAEAKMFFRVGKECRYQAGEQARLAINLNRLHVFDPDTTDNLLWA
ncbi:ABC transporter ATP-binding protein [Ramlibacter alkalitolerans]|uniref:Sn-glycerol-3-phosphate ABC transporter ATP-binding protein UgpC n=1 Tax=Ramlibacter alkalitolerans TaxID=2039631 RepID=A0ABS1JM88_9BURK|nr:sn-glycerol-3-phosphate ABC transporter ATP-binding protein UgpC [Ramlibacter alkalitolerans]MBL0425246.1 sn-glycerol-3-phosphate ABC transporter ATP-binding protein UgpC [Ramlibacter alkalitolerans]